MTKKVRPAAGTGDKNACAGCVLPVRNGIYRQDGKAIRGCGTTRFNLINSMESLSSGRVGIPRKKALTGTASTARRVKMLVYALFGTGDRGALQGVRDY